MWQQIILGLLGLFAGITIAGGAVGLVIGLSIIPRYAGITHTADHLLFYEDSMLLGTVFGSAFSLFPISIFPGSLFLAAFGFFSGMFLGGWILALAEMADILPIFSRRIHLEYGFTLIMFFIAAGKVAGAILYFYKNF